jgi:flagellin-like hook-associated protein FlgL
LTFDKTEYSAGELMTITIAADLADGVYGAFTATPAASANLITVTNPFVASTGTASGATDGYVKLVGGKATWTAYAPLATGPITLTTKSGAGGPTTAVTVTATATVVSDGLAQAAADAAAEATDAANAATDAANAAAEAADAATAAAQDAADAVAALSTSVSAMIDALRKQITALTNLVIKIQKKVRA